MSLCNEIIEEAIRRYSREYDCYDKLCRYVADKCEREIIRANTLHAAVTARAKAPRKLDEKLRKKYKQEETLNTVDDALNRVTDLAGVRISTYLEVHRAKVVEEIQKLFDGPSGAAVDVEKRDTRTNSFYRATHCQVALKSEDLVEPFDNLVGLTCEIQVCSLLAHVWNELEHDLVYKPTTGTLSERETDSLQILANLTLSGDVVIKQLFDANAERIKQAQDEASPFQDVYDFVVRMRDAFPALADFGSNAGQLFEDLVALGFNTPTKVREHFLTDGYLGRSAQLVEQLRQYLHQQRDNAVDVEPQSSDALLVLLLDWNSDKVLDRHPMGRGHGRPPRIASFANRFKQMKSQHGPTHAPAEGAADHHDPG